MVALIVTDGFSGGGFDSVKSKTDIMKHLGIEIFVVALGSSINSKEIREMASEPRKKHSYQLNKDNDVDRLVNKLLRQICKARRVTKLVI